MISKEYLHERFDYVDGELYWKVVYSRRLKVGDKAGDIDGTGYRRVMMGKQHYKMHRLIWIMFNGDIPQGLIVDHIDRNKANNRIENLRLASKSANNRNRESTGVTFDRERDKWRAQASVNNTTVMLGRFDTRAEAELEYENFKAFMIQQGTSNESA